VVRVQRLQLQLIDGAETILLQQMLAPPSSLEEAAGAFRWRREVKTPGLPPPRLHRVEQVGAEEVGGSLGNVHGAADCLEAASILLHGLHGPVHRHGAAHKVLQVPDAALSQEVLRRLQVGVAAAGHNPRVLQHLRRVQTQSGVLLQQVADEVLGIVRHVGPVLIVELHLALSDGVEEQLLTHRAVLPLFPAAVGAAASAKRHIAAEKDVHNDTQRPQITLFVIAKVLLFVIIIIHEKRVHNLGGHVLDAADRGEQSRCAHVNIDPAAQVKVAQLDGAGRVVVHAEDVVRLHIAMGNALLVQMLKRLGEAFDNGAGLGLSEADPLLDVAQ
jgi:hypothetical protein